MSDRGIISKIYRELRRRIPEKQITQLKKWSTKLNKKFSPDQSLMAKKKKTHKCSIFLVIRDMTLRLYLKPITMAEIKNSGDNRFWKNVGKRVILVYCWCYCNLVSHFGNQS